MSSSITYTLTVALVDATASAAYPVSDYTWKTIQAHVVGAGSYLVQASSDGTNYINIGAAITVGDEFRTTEDAAAIPRAIKFLRIYTTTHAAGSTFEITLHNPNG